VNKTKDKNRELNERKKKIGENKLMNEKQKVILLAFPLPQLSLFPLLVSLSKRFFQLREEDA
jgi:hypothetical protein